MLVSVSLSIHESKNPPKNYGWFQEDYWEQNDIGSMDWNHPLREAPEGGVIDNLHLMDKMYEFRNEENSKGRYFPKDKKIKDKKEIVPPVEKDKKEEEKPLIIAGLE
jgi:hypothetical protein